ncbi:MAG: hypothetical protein M3378_02555 [Actinomycetota bacterium]|nr:hypothetical protein [Actinomycetota bacterium]
MRGRAVPLLLLLTGVLLVAAGVVILLERSRSPVAAPTVTSAPPAAPGAAPAPPPAPATTPLDTLVRQLQGFVERERGLTFKTPVKVSLLDDAAFGARVLQTDDEDREEIERAQLVLRAMGLLSRDVDLVKTVEGFVAAGVVGLYDPETKELVVRGGELSPSVRVTLVHELTHALEDQHFNLDRKDLGDEASLGFSALVEGSALRLDEAYKRSLSPAERAQARKEESAQVDRVPPNVPEVVQAALGFPYVFGEDVVSALLKTGGNTRLDAAFADPPSSTEQVLDPRRYLNEDEPRAVPVPRADLPAFDDGEIGQLFLLLMLRSELGLNVARDAAEGWGGDRYVAWRQGELTCVRMDFVMDNPAENDELVKALSDWAQRRKGSASSAGASLTTCG